MFYRVFKEKWNKKNKFPVSRRKDHLQSVLFNLAYIGRLRCNESSVK